MPDNVPEDMYVSLNACPDEIEVVKNAKVMWKEPSNIKDFLKLRRRIECGRLYAMEIEFKNKEYSAQLGNKKDFFRRLNQIGLKAAWLIPTFGLCALGKMLGYAKYVSNSKEWEKTTSTKSIERIHRLILDK
jgi:hypothetical protein